MSHTRAGLPQGILQGYVPLSVRARCGFQESEILRFGSVRLSDANDVGVEHCEH